MGIAALKKHIEGQIDLDNVPKVKIFFSLTTTSLQNVIPTVTGYKQIKIDKSVTNLGVCSTDNFLSPIFSPYL